MQQDEAHLSHTGDLSAGDGADLSCFLLREAGSFLEAFPEGAAAAAAAFVPASSVGFRPVFTNSAAAASASNFLNLEGVRVAVGARD